MAKGGPRVRFGAVRSRLRFRRTWLKARALSLALEWFPDWVLDWPWEVTDLGDEGFVVYRLGQAMGHELMFTAADLMQQAVAPWAKPEKHVTATIEMNAPIDPEEMGELYPRRGDP